MKKTKRRKSTRDRGQARTKRASVRERFAPDPYIRTAFGRAYLGNSLDLIQAMPEKSVDLIMTSPPFGLVRKKAYGNQDADQYVEWFRPFGAAFKHLLKDTGSLVIDIGGSWKAGEPTRSLYHFKLLIALCDEFGFHLAQEFYWWNPSKLPTPAEWVNVRRIRVKDAVNSVYWLSPTPWPKASNRRVLQPYSDSMRELLTKGYTAKLRPSGHDISDKFSVDNGASIPPNLISIANTESNSAYLRYCEQHGLKAHPARYPSALPEYFIRMLTDEGDLVVDPFGGSCVTGEVCERLRRKWICVELVEDYLKGAKGRFSRIPSPVSKPHRTKTSNVKNSTEDKQYYKATRPDILWRGVPTDRLPADGGKKRPVKPTRIAVQKRREVAKELEAESDQEELTL